MLEKRVFNEAFRQYITSCELPARNKIVKIMEEDQTSNDIEAEANYFASCFLMPGVDIKDAFLGMLANSRKAKIKDYLYIKNDYTFSICCGIREDLMKLYGVSEAALGYHLKQLGLARFDFSK